MTRMQRNQQSGFTVVELAVTLGIFLVAMLAISEFLFGMQKSQRITQARIDNQELVRLTLQQMAREIRGSNPIGTYSSVGTYANSIDVASGPTDGTQTFDRWSLSGNSILKQTLSGSGGTVTSTHSILLNAINAQQGLAFLKYYDSAGNELATTGSNAVTSGDITNCTVRIHIAITADPSPGPIFTEEQDVELRNRLPGGVGC